MALQQLPPTGRVGIADDAAADDLTPPPTIIGSDAPLPEAARTMTEYGVHHRAVAESPHQFLGVPAWLALVRALADNR